MASPDEPLDGIESRFPRATDETEWIPLALTLVEYPQGSGGEVSPDKVSAGWVDLNVPKNGSEDLLLLTITCVHKFSGDVFGQLLAVISLIPFAIVAGFLTLILFRRDLHTIVFFIGVAVNESINYVLKHTIRQARPLKRDGQYAEYGMPSTHAQFMWFFAAYATLFIYFRLNYNCTIAERFWRTIVAIGCIVTAILVTCSRVYLLYHSNTQVFCGALIGIAMGTAWFITMHTVLTPFFPIVVSWRISEFLLLRDTTLIPNVLWFEYTNIRTEARARARKLSAIGRSH